MAMGDREQRQARLDGLGHHGLSSGARMCSDPLEVSMLVSDALGTCEREAAAPAV